MSKIREELVKAAGFTPKRGESEADQNLRLVKAISEDLDDKGWNALSGPAQDWNNDAADAITAGKEIPPFPDAEPAAPATTPMRRRGAGKVEETKIEVGANVVIVTKRNKHVEGIIVEMDDDGYVLNKDGEKGDEANDVEVPKSTVQSIALSNTPEAAEAGATTKAGEGKTEDGEVEPEVPEVGDTIQVETKRGKVIMGNLIEAEGDNIVLKDAKGEEHELTVSTLKSWEMKVKGKKAEDKPTGRRGAGKTEESAATGGGRRRGGAAADGDKGEEGGKRTRSSNDRGVSVGTRVSEIMLDNPGISVEDVGKKLKKEGLDFRDNTLTLNYASTSKFIELLKARKMMK